MLDEGDIAIYLDQGYENRRDYLECLADDHGVDIEDVLALADLLGPSEDFDGLVTSVQNIS